MDLLRTPKHSIKEFYDADLGTLWLDYYNQIALSKVTGYKTRFRYGRNTAINTGVGRQVIWDGGTTALIFNTTAQPTQVLSSSAADTAAGTGARTVFIYGLDGSYNEQSEIVIMNGVTPVSTAFSYLRISEAFVMTVGSGGLNAGNITIRNTGGFGNLQSLISASVGRTRNAFFTIPANKTGLFKGGILALNTSAGALVRELDFELVIIPQGMSQQTLISLGCGFGAPVPINLVQPLVLPEKTDIFLVGGNPSLTNTDATGGFEILVIDNSVIS